MMTEQEKNLIRLMEECAEVQHCISKILRFGMLFHNPETGVRNDKKLIQECADLVENLEKVVDTTSAEFIQYKEEKTRRTEFFKQYER